MVYYLVHIQQQGQEGYLFNTRTLVGDRALAKQFTSIPLAKRFLKKSDFAALPYALICVEEVCSDE